MEQRDVDRHRRRPVRLDRRGAAETARLGRAGAGRPAISALLHRREPAGALPGFRRGGGHAAGGRGCGLSVQERRGVHPRRASTATSTSATSSRRGATRLIRCSARRSTSCWPTKREKQGVEIRYETRVDGGRRSAATPRVTRDRCGGARVRRRSAGSCSTRAASAARCRKLLDLETPSTFPVRNAVFTHVADHAPDGAFDRNKIQIVVHPQHRDVWYWLIPFPHGRCSLGCVARKEFFDSYPATPGRAAAQAGERRAVPDARAGERASGTRRCASCPATPRT